MKYIFYFLFFFTFYLHADSVHLCGKVTSFSTDNVEEISMRGHDISLLGTTLTLQESIGDDGKFCIPIVKNGKPQVKAGELITVRIKDSRDWFMIKPYDGIFFLPKSLETFFLDVKLLGNKSVMKIENFTIKANNGKFKQVQYCVQISSFSSTNAQKSANSVKNKFNRKWKNKYNAFIETINVKGKKVYKVLVSVSPSSKLNSIKAKNKIKKVYKGAFVRLIVR